MEPAAQHAAEEQSQAQNDLGKKRFASIPKLRAPSTSWMPRTRREQQTLQQAFCLDSSSDQPNNLHLAKEYLLKMYPLRPGRERDGESAICLCSLFHCLTFKEVTEVCLAPAFCHQVFNVLLHHEGCLVLSLKGSSAA